LDILLEANLIYYETKLSAYYYPTLTDVEDEMPTLEVPPPSLKNSPLIPYINESKEKQS
jgi:type IV pilus assembly protein PilO